MTLYKSLTRLMWCLTLVLVLTCSSALAADDVTPLSSFTYTHDAAQKTVTLTKYTGSSATVCVAPTYTVDGTPCSVVLDTLTLFKGNTSITGVTLKSGVRFLNNSTESLFQGCLKLANIDMTGVSTAGVTTMERMFESCEALTQLDVSGFDTSSVTNMCELFSKCTRLGTLTGYQTWDTGSVEKMYKTFNYVSNTSKTMEVIDLSKWDLDQLKSSGWTFQRCAVPTILLPEDIGVMGAGFMNHVSRMPEATYTIPANVKQIGYAHTFHDFGTNAFTTFAVPAENKNFKAVEGVLYTGDGKKLLGVPRGRRFAGDTMYLPEGVEFMAECSFSYNYNVKTLVLSDSYVFEPFVPCYDDRYIINGDIGNLNGGNSISIALYVYSGTTAYETKPTNPNYDAKDGILYTRDMKELLAIPTIYASPVNVPEGTERWGTHAIYFDISSAIKDCPSVSIPASMSYIAQDQVDALNDIRTRYRKMTISVADGNENYFVDEGGMLQVKRIPKEAIHLDRTEFTYDGTAQTPGVKVSLYDEAAKPLIVKAYTAWGDEEGLLRLTSYLQEDEDYTVEYLNNEEPGTATVRIHGLGKYSGYTDVPFTIKGATPPADPENPDVPATGDATPVALLLTLLALASAALLLRKRLRA